MQRTKQMQLVTGHVYVIQCNEFVKIGFASDFASRLNAMQIGNPYKLKLLKIFPTMTPEAMEDRIHAELEQYRERGEWFKLPPEVLAELIR